jgi:hypothetical protein
LSIHYRENEEPDGFHNGRFVYGNEYADGSPLEFVDVVPPSQNTLPSSQATAPYVKSDSIGTFIGRSRADRYYPPHAANKGIDPWGKPADGPGSGPKQRDWNGSIRRTTGYSNGKLVYNDREYENGTPLDVPPESIPFKYSTPRYSRNRSSDGRHSGMNQISWTPPRAKDNSPIEDDWYIDENYDKSQLFTPSPAPDIYMTKPATTFGELDTYSRVTPQILTPPTNTVKISETGHARLIVHCSEDKYKGRVFRISEAAMRREAGHWRSLANHNRTFTITVRYAEGVNAAKWILAILHDVHNVPDTLSCREFGYVAAIASKLGCHPALQVYVHQWLKDAEKIESRRKARSLPWLLYVAHEVLAPALMHSVARTMQYRLGVNEYGNAATHDGMQLDFPREFGMDKRIENSLCTS